MLQSPPAGILVLYTGGVKVGLIELTWARPRCRLKPCPTEERSLRITLDSMGKTPRYRPERSALPDCATARMLADKGVGAGSVNSKIPLTCVSGILNAPMRPGKWKMKSAPRETGSHRLHAAQGAACLSAPIPYPKSSAPPWQSSALPKVSMWCPMA